MLRRYHSARSISQLLCHALDFISSHAQTGQAHHEKLDSMCQNAAVKPSSAAEDKESVDPTPLTKSRADELSIFCKQNGFSEDLSSRFKQWCETNYLNFSTITDLSSTQIDSELSSFPLGLRIAVKKLKETRAARILYATAKAKPRVVMAGTRIVVPYVDYDDPSRAQFLTGLAAFRKQL